MKKLFTASTTIIASSASIITLVTRSRPLFSPTEHTSTATATTIPIKSIIIGASDSIAVNCSATPAESSPDSSPAAVDTK